MISESEFNATFDLMIKKFTSEQLLDAVEAGGEVIADVYRQALKVNTPPPGNTGQHAYKSVGVKTGIFHDGTGAWAIVGPLTRGGKMLSPQMMWGEFGTEIRTTKSGANRGRMPVMGWLAKANAEAVQAARAAIIARLNRGN